MAHSQADDGRFAIIFNRLRISLNRIRGDVCPDRVQGQREKENALFLHKSSLKLSFLLPTWLYRRVQETWLGQPQREFLTRERGLSSHLGDHSLWFAQFVVPLCSGNVAKPIGMSSDGLFPNPD